MKYRSEIDGLRALAVIPVILFHAGFELFSGGFIGVDIFFVISGYLITTILIDNIESEQFSIVEFYGRRARRILPALFTVLLACTPFAWMWMPANQMEDFSQSLISVSLFLSNILFWQESGYFDAVAEEKPLLHTWSLAVEEQYYLFFPIFLILAWRFGKNRAFWIIVAVAGTSFVLSEWGWRYDKTANFYLAPTRAWELLSGSVASFIVQKNEVRNNNTLALMGFSAIVFSIVTYDENIPFPSIYTLVPVLGTVLLVLYAGRGTLVAKLLSTKMFVGIGLISYSAYLWHQPLFAFARIRSPEYPSLLLMSVLSVASIALAFVSWKYIEIPFRKKNVFHQKEIFQGSLLFLIVFMVFGSIGVQTNGYKRRIERIAGWKEIMNIPFVANTYCHEEGRRTANQMQNDDYCIIGSGELEFAIIGDSHAAALFDAAGDFLSSIEKSSLAVSGGFCAPLLNGFSAGNDCTESIRIALEYAIASESIDTIILSAEWANYTAGYRGSEAPQLWRDNNGVANNYTDNVEVFRRSFAATFDALSSSGKRVYILLPVPEFHQDAYNWVEKRLITRQANTLELAITSLPPIFTSDYETRNYDVLSIFNRHSARNVFYVDVKELFCDAEKCHQYDNRQTILYSDFNHVNYYGAQKIIHAVASELNHP